MRVMWVIASPIGDTAKILFGKEEKYGSGHWIDDTSKSLVNNTNSTNNIELAIVTTSNVDSFIKKTTKHVEYYCLNMGKSQVGKRFSLDNSCKVKYVVEDFQPDIIHIWGSETGIGLLFAESVKDIPIVLCLQGVMTAIAKYPNGGLSRMQLTGLSILDLIKYPIFNKINKSYLRQSKIEKLLIENIDHIISESEWAYAFCKAIKPEIKTHWFPLQIGDAYKSKNWNAGNIDKHRIFTISSRGAHKGIHVLLKAMSIVVKRYPNTKLYVPGKNPFKEKGIRSKIFQTPYTSYLKKMIKNYGLENNITFTGMLSSDEMTDQLCKCNVFVMPSSIENQSASLREALSIGVPSIASFVGCVDESILHGKNGFLYRYEEYEVLAHYISLIFDDDKLAEQFSINAIEHMSSKYFTEEGGKILYSIYKTIISE